MASITSYATLKSALQVWAVRPDTVFGNQVPLFVELAEARLYNGAESPGDDLYSAPVRSSVMEATATVSLTSGEGEMPADWLSTRSIYRTDDLHGMTYLTPERFKAFATNQFGGSAEPMYFTLDGTTLKVSPSITDTVEVGYFKSFAPITTSVTTNDFIVTHGILYLEACLFEAFSFLQEPAMALGHLARLRSLISGVNRTAQGNRQPGPQRVRVRNPIP